MEKLTLLALLSCFVLSTAFPGIVGAETRHRMTVRDVVTAIIRYSVGDRELSVSDRLITGSYDAEVTGIVVTFMATVDVIRKATGLGANLIITHEPTLYTGGDTTDWLENDPVYLEKKKLIESHGIAIWRYHDSMHMAQPGGIYAGLWKAIDWERYLVSTDNPWIYEIPETTLADLARFFKEKLSVGVVRIAGNPDMKVSRVGILVGGGSLGLGREEI